MSHFIKVGEGGKHLAGTAKKRFAVIDERTGLMWTVGETKSMTQPQALEHVKTLDDAGFTDWRLPTIEELFLLADRSKFKPAIDTAFFPKCQNDWYWTSSPYAGSPGDCAWFVGFWNGCAYYGARGFHGFVRAVRSARSGQ